MAAAAQRRPADSAAGAFVSAVVSTVECLESRQFLSAGHGAWFPPDRPALAGGSRDHAVYVSPLTTAFHRSATEGFNSARRDFHHVDVPRGGSARPDDRNDRRGNPDVMHERSEFPHVRDAAGAEWTDPKVNVDGGATPTVGGTVLVIKESAAVTTVAVFYPVVVPLFVVRGVVPAPPALDPGAVSTAPATPPVASGVAGPMAPQAVRQAADGVSRPAAVTPGGIATTATNGIAQVVASVSSASTAALVTVARAAGEVLSGGPVRSAMVAGAVAGVGVTGDAARAVAVGTAQGFFSIALAALFDDGAPADDAPTPPAAAVRAVATSVESATTAGAQVAARGADVVAGAVETAVGQLVPRRFFHIARVDALAAFNDAMAAFVDESATLPQAAAAHRRTRAWVVTAAVLAADAALLVYWHKTRGKKGSGAGRRRTPVRRLATVPA